MESASPVVLLRAPVRVGCVLVTTLAVGLSSCGGGSSPSTPTPTSPITKGILLISQTSDALYGMTPAGLWRIKIPVEVKAMNEISLTLTAARADVLVLGVYHMANPGRDIFNMKADDVLAPRRQAETVELVEVLKRFRPTKVAVERASSRTRASSTTPRRVAARTSWTRSWTRSGPT